MKTNKLLQLIQQKRVMRSGGALPLPKAIEGNQGTCPEGYVKDKKGNCIPVYTGYKMPDATQVNSVSNTELSNTQIGNNAKSSNNWNQSARLINSYNDGTPNDTSYIYMEPHQSVYINTEIGRAHV